MLYKIENEKLSVEVSMLGGELKSIKDNKGHEYLWQGDATYWEGQAPNLFPYIARLTKGKYTFLGKEYSMGIHGFLKDSQMEVLSLSEKEITLLLKSSSTTKSQYPFEFELHIIYELINESLKISYKIINCDEKTMYFAIGGHPGFNIPMSEGLEFEDYYLQFENSNQTINQIGFTKDCFLNGERTPFLLSDARKIKLTHSLFDNDAIVLENAGTSVLLKSDKDKQSIKIDFSDMKYIGFWHTPKTDAPYICIEPWSALPSRKGVVEDISKQEDIIHLKSNDVYINSWDITIKND